MGAILLAIDGSEHARKAAVHAIELADERDATLHVICVVDKRRFYHPALSSAELATIYAEDNAVVCVDEVTQMAKDSNVRSEGSIRHGTPHESILEYAEEIDADTIVLGEHGTHEEHLPGVGQKVIEGTDRDVRVVEAE